MTVHCLMLLASLTAVAGEQVIDTFEYADSQAAREAWVASSGTPPAEMVRVDGRSVLQMHAPFATDGELERTILDREVDLDLAVPGQFLLEMAVDVPEVAGRVNLYFRSGDGWYASGGGFAKKGRQTLRFSKASFSIEGEPAGWHKIDGVRISVWRGQPEDYSIRIARLAAVWHDVALVIPAVLPKNAHEGDREIRNSLRAAEDFGSMLDELGLGADAVEDAALGHGALGQRQVAVLAYNPRLPLEAVEALTRFVEGGGKLFACYNLPSPLAQLLGIGRMQYFRPDEPGTLAEVRFDAPDVPGLPKSVRQASWNITVPEPNRPDARVIGYWHDAEGNSTGHAAMLLSDRGAFFSHLVLPDDRPAKKQMLAAVLGRLHPPLWERMASSELERIGQVGHLEGFEAVADYVKSSGNAEALERLEAAAVAEKAARSELAQEGYPKTVELARRAHELLVEAYCRSPASRAAEGRAFWNHSGTGAYPGDWERSAKELTEAGFNMVVPNLLWAGRAHYASDVLPRSKTYEEHGDQIAQCVAASKKYGLEVHVWKVNYNLSGAPADFVQKLREENRLQESNGGEQQKWLCPSHPENFHLELESMLEVARKYDVDGLHFDYIRYPNRNHCYCDGCRQRFTTDTGLTVTDWPKECHSGKLHDPYHDWRCAQITRLVAAVHREAKKIKPGIKISAAVFGAYPDCRESVGQDWVEWVKAGYLDFVCPMDYSQSDPYFIGLVENQLRLVDGRIPVYPGIGAWRLTPDRVIGQIHHARWLGAPGFTLFNLDAAAASSVLPAVAQGAGSQRAVPPHKTR
ncbi:MAG: family 10 glycosylhydrolase [Planctomycetota bacterium]